MSAPPRVLLVSHAGEMGGAEHVLASIARHLGPRCHAVLFADGAFCRLLQTAGIGVTVLSAGRMLRIRRQGGLGAIAALPSVLRMALRLARIARGYDLIYASSQKAAVVSLLVGRMIRRPVVWHLHDILSAAHFSALQRQLVVRLANAGASRVIAISDAVRESFVVAGGTPRRVVTVLNGIDPAPFAQIDDTAAAALRHRLAAGAPLIGLFGRISPWKGQDVLIEALTHLPGVHALLVGDALFGDRPCLEAAQAQAIRLGVADRVHWLGHRGDIPALMAVCDVVVHASIAPEPFGLVIVEAMLAGRPVLATDHGASREILADAEWALVPPGDATALAARIAAELHTAPALAAQRAAHNRARAMELFSLPAMLNGVDRVLAAAA